MPATMLSMELIHADNLTPDQLMPEDLIEIEDGIVEVVSINSDSTGDKYFIEYRDEFGEVDVIEYNFNSQIKLFVFIQGE